ncbi:hypothetical protein FOIG_12530 [Fusarium odoratissimum NRRL 54006]|uniref:Bulb-type lectin domain-containing protein n=1 Tax=Fusarium odoratissimum (strain NRRL 54006) TaxID=1089451 RepID=X0KCH6_FUSO5|nr:uncharacterized protein FOIG_12530 [Fusarium odoratissimum NRRL 54006]EXL94684.1 hypothetical protein FOIG_12530 [Fusarium odoratissimum NRRL 54006]
MPLLLAPYDDAMRLGMGFNSYTQTMCIYSYSAVEATDENMITSQTLPPKITYSSKLFEWVSEVVDTMDISRAATSRPAGWKSKDTSTVKKASTDSTMDLGNICKVATITSVIQGVKVEDVTAIRTKYKENRSFNEWSTYQVLKPLDYDSVASYTSKLFDNYMQYKHLSRKVQDIISHLDYLAAQVDKPRAISLELNTLLAARSAIDKDINKIVVVVNTLTRHPEANNPKDELVYGIINEALLESPQPGSLEDSQVQHNFFLPSVPGYSPSETSSGVEELHTPWTFDLDSASLSGRSPVFRGKTEPSTDLAMRVLVQPEVWADLLPVKIDHLTSLINQKTQTVPAFTVKYKRLHILAAVFGTHDVAVKLREWSIETLEITHESESQNAKFVHPSRSTCFILGVTYGGKIYSSSEDLLRFVDNADHGTPRDWLYIHFNRETIKDEHLGKDGMTGVVLYTYSILNGVQSAVSMGTAGCMLVDQRQLTTVTKETVNGANDNLLKKDSKEVKTHQITLGKGIEAPEGYSCTFQSGTLKVSPSETPFMQFKNGVKFALRNNGRFEVLDKQDEAFWSSEEVPEGQIPRRLEFCKDGKLRLWNTDEQVYWTPLMNFTRCERKMVFSSEFPHLEIYNSEV